MGHGTNASPFSRDLFKLFQGFLFSPAGAGLASVLLISGVHAALQLLGICCSASMSPKPIPENAHHGSPALQANGIG